MKRRNHNETAYGNLIRLLIIAGMFTFSAAPSESAEVIVVGDTQLKPVVEIISGIKETLGLRFEIYNPASVKGRLNSIVSMEKATVVIALGKDAIDETVGLPSSVAVIYDLVIKPPAIERPNTTGFYLSTPVMEYVNIINRYLPPLKRIGVVGSPDLMDVLDKGGNSQVRSYKVKSPYELVSTVSQLSGVDAILLLPDVSLLTASAVDEVYLLSFRKGIPVLGVSEKHVKQGGLLALVFDPAMIGRQIGEKASDAARGADMGRIPPSPSKDFDLFINTDTAWRMGISIPNELLKRAKKVYP